MNLYKSNKQKFQLVNKRGSTQFKFNLMASPKESHWSILDGDQKIEEEESFSYAMHVVGDIHYAVHGLKAIELGVFDILAKARPRAKLSPSQIVAQMPTKNPNAAIPHSQAAGQRLCAWLRCGCGWWELWVFSDALQSYSYV